MLTGLGVFWTQAALGAVLEANERHSKSSESYRMQVADEVYPNKLVEICGPNGHDGTHPFVVKKRNPRDGGDWTFDRSAKERVGLNGQIYKQGKKAISEINNQINPIYLKLCPGGQLPSGWNEDDAVNMVEYNLQLVADGKKKKRSAEVVDVDPLSSSKRKRAAVPTVATTQRAQPASLGVGGQWNDTRRDGGACCGECSTPS